MNKWTVNPILSMYGTFRIEEVARELERNHEADICLEEKRIADQIALLPQVQTCLQRLKADLELALHIEDTTNKILFSPTGEDIVKGWLKYITQLESKLKGEQEDGI